MSLSSPEVQKPYSKVIEFKGSLDKGKFYYYDKSLGDDVRDKNVEVPYPLKFIVLDQLNAISGFNENAKKGIYSNMIRSIKLEDLVVKCDGGIIGVGKYHEIQDSVKARGGKFTKMVFAAMATDDGLEMVLLKLSGGAMAAWFDFQKKNSSHLTSAGVIVKDECVKAKKGSNVYLVPTFRLLEIKAETMKVAIEMDKGLQKYLKDMFQKDREEDVVVTDIDADGDTFLDGVEYEDKMTATLPDTDLGKKDDDDLPF